MPLQQQLHLIDTSQSSFPWDLIKISLTPQLLHPSQIYKKYCLLILRLSQVSQFITPLKLSFMEIWHHESAGKSVKLPCPGFPDKGAQVSYLRIIKSLWEFYWSRQPKGVEVRSPLRDPCQQFLVLLSFSQFHYITRPLELFSFSPDFHLYSYRESMYQKYFFSSIALDKVLCFWHSKFNNK